MKPPRSKCCSAVSHNDRPTPFPQCPGVTYTAQISPVDALASASRLAAAEIHPTMVSASCATQAAASPTERCSRHADSRLLIERESRNLSGTIPRYAAFTLQHESWRSYVRPLAWPAGSSSHIECIGMKFLDAVERHLSPKRVIGQRLVRHLRRYRSAVAYATRIAFVRVEPCILPMPGG
jgi:hypothetical protein